MAFLGEVIALVSEAFAKDTDKGGRPYVLHCFAVMENTRHMGVTDDLYLAAAFAHDLGEDKPGYLPRLVQIAVKFNKPSLPVLVDHLSRRPGEPYDVFIDRIIATGDVKLIKTKKGDIKHNSSLTRLKGVTEKDFDRMATYQVSYVKLDEAQSKLEN
ncbi:hypothetical protein [Pseudomonas phage Astolliot]|nr:hypothetical protein [Pseudomonas phage Astolliot]